MARKTVSIKAKREEAEAAEKSEAAEKKVAKKKPAKRKSRAKAAKEIRLKAFWGVFNQSLRRIALYEYSQKKEAEKKAKDLSASGKSPHFVQPVKEAIEEECSDHSDVPLRQSLDAEIAAPQPEHACAARTSVPRGATEGDPRRRAWRRKGRAPLSLNHPPAPEAAARLGV